MFILNKSDRATVLHDVKRIPLLSAHRFKYPFIRANDPEIHFWYMFIMFIGWNE